MDNQRVAPDARAAMARSRSLVRSATIVAPALRRLFPRLRSAVEVGCGSAAWLSMLNRHGVADVLGVDTGPQASLHIDETSFRDVDLQQPFALGRTFDLALCLNAAEHLPAARAAGFVADLCATSSLVVFCAAVPGESGAVHERWPSYWSRLFATQGFECIDCLRPLIWTDSRVDWRYAQSLLCFATPERRAHLPGLDGTSIPVQLRDIVHPLAQLNPAA